MPTYLQSVISKIVRHWWIENTESPIDKDIAKRQEHRGIFNKPKCKTVRNSPNKASIGKKKR